MEIFSKPFNRLKASEIAILRSLAEERFDFFCAYFLGTALQPFHLRWVEFQLNYPRTLILGPRACWKCVSSSSFIPTPLGLKYLKDVINEPSTLPYVDKLEELIGSCLGWTKTSYVFCNGFEEVLEFTTEDGYTLRVTPEHHLLVWDGNRLAFKPAWAIAYTDQILFRGHWQSFATEDINPFNVDPDIWFSALAYFYVCYNNWMQIWERRYSRRFIARPLWRHFNHSHWNSLPPQFESFLKEYNFGSEHLPSPLLQCTPESARIIGKTFWWLNQHIKFTEEQAKQVQIWFLNLGIILKRVGPTLQHVDSFTRSQFHQLLRTGTGDALVSQIESHTLRLASSIFMELGKSASVPPYVKFRAREALKRGELKRPEKAANFVKSFLPYAPKLSKLAFMFRSPFFLQRVKHISKQVDLTYDFTTIEGNYLVNGAVSHNSTVCGKFYGMWRALRNPNIRIGIVSKSSQLSSMFVGQIKHIFETNERILHTWKHLINPRKAQKWNSNELTLIRPASLANATFTALGVGSSLAGHHFDILIFDDVVDTDHQISPSLRKRLWDWFRFVAMQTLSIAEETQAHVIGTLYHPDDLYHHLIKYEREGRGQWKSLIQPAIQSDGTSFWEDMFPLSALQEIETTWGNDVFQLQYQNNPDFSRSGLTWDMFESCYYDPQVVDAQKLEVIIGVDLASPESKDRARKSAFAIAVVGFNRTLNKFFLLDIFKRTDVRLTDQRAFIENFFTRYPYTSTIQIEAYATQSYFHDYLAESEMPLPYVKVATGGTKDSRFEHILNLLTVGRFYVVEHLHNEFLEEILSFPQTSADLIDAVYLALKGFHREPKIRFLRW